jgi:hypothetical protein
MCRIMLGNVIAHFSIMFFEKPILKFTSISYCFRKMLTLFITLFFLAVHFIYYCMLIFLTPKLVDHFCKVHSLEHKMSGLLDLLMLNF